MKHEQELGKEVGTGGGAGSWRKERLKRWSRYVELLLTWQRSEEERAGRRDWGRHLRPPYGLWTL